MRYYIMKKKKSTVITIEEKDFKDSKFSTREWESRVNITRWEHNYEDKKYYITLG